MQIDFVAPRSAFRVPMQSHRQTPERLTTLNETLLEPVHGRKDVEPIENVATFLRVLARRLVQRQNRDCRNKRMAAFRH